MSQNTKSRQLMESNRWMNFLESTAMGLRLNLTLVLPEVDTFCMAPRVCPFCQCEFPELNNIEKLTALGISGSGPASYITENGHAAVSMYIQEGLWVVARDCPQCSGEDLCPSLQDRGLIAHRLLSSFNTALSEGLEGGLRAVELSTLRQMNHIVLTLIQGESDALGRAFNLILSALVILLDAQGSWLEYKVGDKPVVIIIGDEEAVAHNLKSKTNSVVTAEVINGSLHGRMGVLQPSDMAKAKSLLSMMAQECAIVFEINSLFKLLKAQLTMVLGAVGSAVLLVSQDGVISYVNNAAEKLLGRQAVFLTGSSAANLKAPWTPYIVEKIQRLVKGQMGTLGEGSNRRWVDWQVAPLRDNESVAGWVVMAEDRTDYYRWQEAACQAQRFATTATMLGALAHELRNPLSSAKGLLQLMGRKRDYEKVRGYNNLVIREIDRVTSLLNEFLLLGKPADINSEPLDLKDFINELVPLLEGEAAIHQAEMVTILDKVPPVAVDPGQMTQLLLNLVRNALEAAGPNGTVTLALSATETGVAIRVKDSGQGIAPENIEKIFQPFFTTKERGTGLGLSVTQAIAKNHGGQITAENSPEGGALFTVLLPTTYRITHRATEVDVVIVLTDDFLRYPCEQALRAVGTSVFSAANLSEIVAVVENFDPSILVLEPSSQIEDSLDFFRQAWPNTKILLFGEPAGDLKEKVNVQIIKGPLDYSHLISKIKFLLDNNMNL